MQVHDWLVNQYNLNPWIKKDLLLQRTGLADYANKQ
jgi:hypothetical protein